MMNMCIESLSSLWISFLVAVGLSRIDKQRDALWSAQDMLDNSITKIEGKILAVRSLIGKTSMGACAAHKSGNRQAARAQVLRLRRIQGHERQLENLLSSLETQRDAIDCNDLNETMLTVLKQSTQALSTLQKESHVQDASQVDSIRQEMEDQMRHVQEITETASAPIGYVIDDYGIDDDALDAALEELSTADGIPEMEHPTPHFSSSPYYHTRTPPVADGRGAAYDKGGSVENENEEPPSLSALTA